MYIVHVYTLVDQDKTYVYQRKDYVTIRVVYNRNTLSLQGVRIIYDIVARVFYKRRMCSLQ